MTKQDFREWIRESIGQAIERIEQEEQPKWAGYVTFPKPPKMS